LGCSFAWVDSAKAIFGSILDEYVAMATDAAVNTANVTMAFFMSISS